MANFLIIIDADRDRRRKTIESAEVDLAPVPGLVTAELDLPPFGAVWAAAPSAPVDVARDRHHAAVVWGHATIAPERVRVTARRLTEAWNPQAVDPPETFDGFHAAVAYYPDSGLTVGADLLGLYPVFYATAADAILISSSPELIARHPAFRVQVDLQGLVGSLLLHCPFQGKLIVRGIRRLAAGHLLRWSNGGSAREVCQYTIPVSGGYEAQPFEAQVDGLGQVLSAAVDRQVPDGPSGLMLSGGRDSRMLGGFLAERGRTARALTLGWKTDYEVRCARRVAKRLGLEHLLGSIEYDRFPRTADLQVKWEHLGTGFSSVHSWASIEWLRRLPPAFVAGYLVGPTVGGAGLMSAEAPQGRVIPFDRFLVMATRRTIEPSRLSALLRRDVAAGLIETTVADARAVYEGYDTPETQRVWRFLLAHWERFHAGAVPWRLTFGSWPILPILDREVLDLLGRLPSETLANRRGQDALLCRRFPALARLELDRNWHNTDPLLPTRWFRARRSMERRWRQLRPWRRSRRGSIERRYYYRMYDINGPGWREIRKIAEPHRDRLADWFDMDALREFLPAPEAAIDLEDGIRDAYPRKMVVGLMLWSGRNLA